MKMFFFGKEQQQNVASENESKKKKNTTSQIPFIRYKSVYNSLFESLYTGKCAGHRWRFGKHRRSSSEQQSSWFFLQSHAKQYHRPNEKLDKEGTVEIACK